MWTYGPPWIIACAALAALWIGAASWNAEAGTWTMALRGLLGGIAALACAYIAYGVLQMLALEPRWEGIQGRAWPALGFAALVGIVEEAAKLAGVLLAT